jgi:alpha-galactosidase
MLKKNACAAVPPMGWNSWDCYAATVTEEQLLGNAEYMAKHLKTHGWEYIVCDIQWSEPTAGTEDCEYIPFARLSMDGYGRLLPAVNRFPSAASGRGFKPIADRIHALGLKFGIHIMRGIPRQAVYARCPVYGTAYTADSIANPFSISRWNGDMFGIDAGKPGAQAYYDSLFNLYAQWGVDFVKVDDICNTNMYPHAPYSAQREIEIIRQAIDYSGRDMTLSLSPGPAVIEKAWHLSQNANMWRITDDFWDDWALLKNMFERCEVWQKHVEPGCWPDCDMLPLGKIGMGFRKGRETRFTPDEQVTMLTLWSIFRSPLMLGCEMRELDTSTLALITNDEVLRLNRHSFGARQLFRDETQAAWISRDADGGYYLALFNLSGNSREISADLDSLCGCASVRDLWAGAELGTAAGIFKAALPPHGAGLYKLHVI